MLSIRGSSNCSNCFTLFNLSLIGINPEIGFPLWKHTSVKNFTPIWLLSFPPWPISHLQPLISVSSHRSHSSTLITTSFQSDKNKFKLISSHFNLFFPKWAGRLINHCSRNFTQSLLFCIGGIILHWSQTHTSSFFRWSSLNPTIFNLQWENISNG